MPGVLRGFTFSQGPSIFLLLMFIKIIFIFHRPYLRLAHLSPAQFLEGLKACLLKLAVSAAHIRGVLPKPLFLFPPMKGVVDDTLPLPAYT